MVIIIFIIADLAKSWSVRVAKRSLDNCDTQASPHEFGCLTCPLHRDLSLLFAKSEVYGCDSPIHGTDGLKSPPKD